MKTQTNPLTGVIQRRELYVTTTITFTVRNVKGKTTRIQIRGHGRRRRREEGGADWAAIATLLITDGMTPEEELRFLWAHPEIEGRYRGPARTEGERRYIPRALRRED